MANSCNSMPSLETIKPMMNSLGLNIISSTLSGVHFEVTAKAMPSVMNCSSCIFANTSPPMSGGPFGVCQVGCKTGRLESLLKWERQRYPP